MVQLTAYQATTPLLERFRVAVGDHGHVTGPYRERLFHWTTKRNDSVSAVLTCLWPRLSAEKRLQIEKATRGSRFEALVVVLMSADRPVDIRAELAWAAGFFDGEGTCWGSRGQVRMEIPQAVGIDGSPSAALTRFQRAIGDIGYITGPRILRNPWSRLPQYRWQVSNRAGVQEALTLLWPWLGAEKRAQASQALFGPASDGSCGA